MGCSCSDSVSDYIISQKNQIVNYDTHRLYHKSKCDQTVDFSLQQKYTFKKTYSNKFKIINFSGSTKNVEIIANSTINHSQKIYQISIKQCERNYFQLEYSGISALLVTNQEHKLSYWVPMIKNEDSTHSDQIYLHRNFAIVNDQNNKAENNSLEFIKYYCQALPPSDDGDVKSSKIPNYFEIKSFSKINLHLQILVEGEKVLEIKQLKPKDIQTVKTLKFGKGKCIVFDENNQKLYELEFQSNQDKRNSIIFAQSSCLINKIMVRLNKLKV